MSVYDRNLETRRELRKAMAQGGFNEVESLIMNNIHWRSTHHGVEAWSGVHRMVMRRDPMGFLMLTIMLDELDAITKERSDG
jgi:hypothetical protein